MSYKKYGKIKTEEGFYIVNFPSFKTNPVLYTYLKLKSFLAYKEESLGECILSLLFYAFLAFYSYYYSVYTFYDSMNVSREEYVINGPFTIRYRLPEVKFGSPILTVTKDNQTWCFSCIGTWEDFCKNKKGIYNFSDDYVLFYQNRYKNITENSISISRIVNKEKKENIFINKEMKSFYRKITLYFCFHFFLLIYSVYIIFNIAISIYKSWR